MAAHPVRVPRVNANDDSVKVLRLVVAEGDKIAAGVLLAEVETEKAVVEIAADRDGYVLRVDGNSGEAAPVGSVLLWVGASLEDAIPEMTPPSGPPARSSGEVTAKARKLLASYGLDAAAVQASGRRLTSEDVERHCKQHGLTPVAQPLSDVKSEFRFPVAGSLQPLTAAERAMARTVQWHKSTPVPAYLEMPFAHNEWKDYAKKVAVANKLLLDPLLGLVAFRLVSLTRQTPVLNATLLAEGVLFHAAVNLGFTVQAKTGLVMVVVRNSQTMDELEFVKSLGKLQRQAFLNRLKAEQVDGATIAFSSLSNAGVVRHIPVLPPNTGVIVAHSAPFDAGHGIIGVTYDHRFLDGHTVARALAGLSAP